MKFEYVILDVFTRHKLTGNPLALVIKAEGLSDGQMQSIAAEFNLSETVFMTQPKLDARTAKLRIFTPTHELPFAGHPTVGAAVFLALKQRLQGVRFVEKVGTVTCVMEPIDRQRASAQFALPVLPHKTGEAPEPKRIAEVLGLSEGEIGCGPYAPARYSAGNEFVLVPVADADALARISREKRGWASVFGSQTQNVFVFTETPNERENDYAARMFAPDLGIGEDPATGSAAGALIGLLAEHEPTADGVVNKVLRQGHEMGRPSTIGLRYTMGGGTLQRAGIGGEAVVVMQGVLDLNH